MKPICDKCGTTYWKGHACKCTPPRPLQPGGKVLVEAFVKRRATALEKHGYFDYWELEVPNGLGGDLIIAPDYAVRPFPQEEV